MPSPSAADWGPLIVQTLVAAVLSGSVVGIALKSLIDRRLERNRLNREWKERSMSSLVGPLAMHFMRTDALSKMYQSTFQERSKSYFHAQLLRESNKSVRSILLTSGHLLPGSLLDPAQDLIAHYDVWLARFDEKEALEKPGPESTFDMGFVKVRFPVEARDAFMQEYARLRRELYGEDGALPSFQRTAAGRQTMEIRVDDLRGPEIAALLEEHLEEMRATSPPESKHALDLDALRRPEITFWTVWYGGRLAGCGAIKELDPTHAEIKSMRTSSDFRRKGIAARLLQHIVDEAVRRGYRRLSLETGSMPYFEPARRLYGSFGFIPCDPFADYREDPNSVFLTRSLA